MAVPDGKPATSFNAMDREWVRAVAKEEANGGIPAPANPNNGDVLTYNSTSAEWEASAPSGGGGVLKLVDTDGVLDHTWTEIKTALIDGAYVSLVFDDGEYVTQVISARIEGEGTLDYIVGFTDTSLMYIASSPDGYPEAD